jgi:hypothetical protein
MHLFLSDMIYNLYPFLKKLSKNHYIFLLIKLLFTLIILFYFILFLFINYMEDPNLCIKNEIILFIEKYKKDDIIQQNIALKIEESVKNIVCFFCLDEKQCWDYRAQQYKGDGKGEFYIKKCPHCLTIHSKNLWIDDCISITELVGPLGIKLFRHDANAGSEKFKELEKYVIQKNPELVKPDFTKSIAISKHTKISTYKLDIEIGNIITACKTAIEVYMGNMPALVDTLVKDIHIHISSVNNESNKNKLLCEEFNTNEFMYIAMKNNSTEKTKSRFGIYNYQKFYLDIQIDIYEIKTLNDSARHLCNKIINKSVEKNIIEIIKLFEQN